MRHECAIDAVESGLITTHQNLIGLAKIAVNGSPPRRSDLPRFSTRNLRVRLEGWFAQVPIRRFLIRRRQREHVELGQMRPADLQPDRQTLFRKSARHRDRRKTVVVKRTRISGFGIAWMGIRQPVQFLFNWPGKLADGWRNQKIDILFLKNFLID
jgi:hypothetical protein